MSKLVVIVPALLAAGCAANRSEIASDAAERAASPATDPALIAAADDSATAAGQLSAIAEKKTVELSELDNGLVCESRRHTGSRISRPVCYTREEQAALQAARREQAQRYAADLAHDQQMREQQQRALEERQRQAIIGGLAGGAR